MCQYVTRIFVSPIIVACLVAHGYSKTTSIHDTTKATVIDDLSRIRSGDAIVTPEYLFDIIPTARCCKTHNRAKGNR